MGAKTSAAFIIVFSVYLPSISMKHEHEIIISLSLSTRIL